MTEKNQQRAIGLALLTVLMWSTVAVPFKIGLTYFKVVHFQFIAISVALMVIAFLLAITKEFSGLRELTRRQWVEGVLAGLINPFLYYLMLFKAYSLLPAQMAQSLNYTWPLMLVLLAVPFLGQKLRPISLVTLLVGFTGVYFIASEGKPWPLSPSNPFGVVIAISTSVLWALYWILNTKSNVSPKIGLFVNFISAWLVMIPIIILYPINYSVPPKAIVSVIYAGVFEMGIPFFVWLMALKYAPRADTISHLVYLSPFISLFFIYLFLDEHIYHTTLIGLALIIFAVLLPKGK